jgi:acetyl-CoA acetyltransferase
MRDVAVVAVAQSKQARRRDEQNEVEMLMPVTQELFDQAGMTLADIGFTCSGSSDYLAGMPFSFVTTLDGIGPWPPISESHVEMDGAWALYEAWVKLQTGAIDTALVYSYGKSSPGEIRDVLTRQLDPYYLQPLWPDSVSLAALQARSLIEAGKASEEEMAAVAVHNRAQAKANPNAQLAGDFEVESLLAEPHLV